jgi:hypothetical protein
VDRQVAEGETEFAAGIRRTGGRAYATVKNWSRLERWSWTGNWAALNTCDSRIRQLLPGTCDPAAVRTRQGADALSEPRAERELILARLATKWQLQSQAEELWLRVEEDPSMRREALDNLRQLYPTNKSRSCAEFSNVFMRVRLTNYRAPVSGAKLGPIKTSLPQYAML